MAQGSHGAGPAMFAGCLEGIGLPDLMWQFCRRKLTGVLRITRHPVTRTLYLEDGRIIFAASSDPNDRLGETLLRQGTISLDQLERALAGLRSGKRLGTLLVEDGTLSAEDLVDAVLGQVKSIALDVLRWEEGEYEFVEGPLPTEEVITLGIRTSELLLLAIRGLHSFSRIRSSVGPLHTVYSLTEDWNEILDELTLTEGERSLVDALAAGGQTVSQLCEDVALSNFEIYQTLWTLKVLGVLDEIGWEQETREASVQSGLITPGGFAELLVSLSASNRTGVLYVSRKTAERSFHIAEGRCLFATSNNTDDGLVTYLLRRGVISLRDRDEVAKRRLSNKRVGTILREIGVLDDHDLHEMIRDHLSEIVFETFLWDDGEWIFVPGPLPTREAITLEVEIPALIARGILRVGSWTHVINGCGGIDQPLGLSPRYLDLLDGMGAGVEEWEVVNALKTPRTPRRICRALELADFRICQILWSLKMLGAVEPVAVEESEELLAGLQLEPEPEPEPEPVTAAPAETRDVPEEVVETADEEPVPEAEAETEARAEVEEETQELEQEELEEEELEEEDLEVEDLEVPAEPIAAATPVPLDIELEPPVHAEPEWALPVDAEQVIDRFNAMHRVVFQAVRAEVGAGASNFVRSCCAQALERDAGNFLADVILDSDGSWDAEGLKQALREHRLEEPWPLCQQVLDELFVTLEPHLGKGRAGELKQHILDLDRG